MKKRNILLIATIAVLITAMIISIGIFTQPKTLIIIDSTIDKQIIDTLTLDTLPIDTLTVDDLIEKTPLIIKGQGYGTRKVANTLHGINPIDDNTIWNLHINKVLKGDFSETHIIIPQIDGHDYYSTVWKIRIFDVLKGDYTEPHIYVKKRGNTVSINPQEKVVLFLTKNTNSSGSTPDDPYHLVSKHVGKYKINNDQLTTHISEFNISEKELMDKIKASLQ